MKKISIYCAVLLVLAVFGATMVAHAGDLPVVPLTNETNSGVPEAGTEFEISITLPTTAALTLSETQRTMAYKSTAKLQANEDVTWLSDHPEIVTVDRDGNLSAVGTGTATVTAEAEDGRTASCTVTVQYTWWQKLIRIFLFGWIWY